MTEAADSSSGKRNERSRSFGKRLFLTLVVLLAIALFGAVTYSPPKSELSFQPIALPVKFIWEDGDVKIAGEQSIITPIGKIAIDANITLGEPNENSFYVTLRDKRRSVDYVYRVDSGTGSFVAIVNGTTQIQVEDRHVTIEVIEGETKTVTFQKVQPSTKRVQTDRVVNGPPTWPPGGMSIGTRGGTSRSHWPVGLMTTPPSVRFHRWVSCGSSSASVSRSSLGCSTC